MSNSIYTICDLNSTLSDYRVDSCMPSYSGPESFPGPFVAGKAPAEPTGKYSRRIPEKICGSLQTNVTKKN